MRPTRCFSVLASLAVGAGAFIVALALPAPAQALTIAWNGAGFTPVVGSGKFVEAARPVGSFSALRSDSSVDIEAHPGTTPAVSVHADDNIEPLIETLVDGDTLVVRTRPGASFQSKTRVRVDVTFVALKAARMSGSGNLHITTLTGPTLDIVMAGSGDLALDKAQLGNLGVTITGSGDARLAGRADDAHFSIAGSGDIAARELVARRVSISIAGSGDAQVHASDAVDARITGSGDVTYHGRPHDVTRRVSGSGSISASN